MVRSRGKLTIFRAELDLWGEWRIYACAVPSAHNQNAREKLRAALRSLADQLRRTPLDTDHFRWEFAYDLACSTARAVS